MSTDRQGVSHQEKCHEGVLTIMNIPCPPGYRLETCPTCGSLTWKRVGGSGNGEEVRPDSGPAAESQWHYFHGDDKG